MFCFAWGEAFDASWNHLARCPSETCPAAASCSSGRSLGFGSGTGREEEEEEVLLRDLQASNGLGSGNPIQLPDSHIQL